MDLDQWVIILLLVKNFFYYFFIWIVRKFYIYYYYFVKIVVLYELFNVIILSYYNLEVEFYSRYAIFIRLFIY